MAEQKVWGIRAVWRSSPSTDDTPRVIVAAPSRAAALRAFKAVGLYVTDSEFKSYGRLTGNPREVETAISQPGTVFCATDGSAREFVPVPPQPS